jgi:tetratricopeptide (TPR) repeat protein
MTSPAKLPTRDSKAANIRHAPRFASALVAGTFAYVALTIVAAAATEADLQNCRSTDPNTSFAACTRIVDDQSDTPEHRREAYVLRGMIYYDASDLDHALSDLNAAINLDAAKADAYYDRGRVHGAKGEYDLAIADFNNAVRLDAQKNEYRIARGIAYRLKGNLDAAILDLTTVISHDSNATVAYFNRAETYLQKKDFDRAITDYSTTILQDPQFSAALRGRARAHMAKHDVNAAVSDLTGAIAADPQDAAAYVMRGLIHAGEPNYPLAVADYTQAVLLAPADPYLHTLRAWTLLKSGDAKTALLEIDTAISLDRDLASSYVTRALIEEALKRDNVAVVDFRKALTLDASLQEAKAGLSRLGAQPK